MDQFHLTPLVSGFLGSVWNHPWFSVYCNYICCAPFYLSVVSLAVNFTLCIVPSKFTKMVVMSMATFCYESHSAMLGVTTRRLMWRLFPTQLLIILGWIMWYERANSPGIVHANSLSHCHDLLGHLNRMEPSLVLSVTHALSLQVKHVLSQRWYKHWTMHTYIILGSFRSKIFDPNVIWIYL